MKNLVTFKKVILSLTIIFAGYSFANAQSCGGFGQVLKSSWEEFYTVAHPIGKSALKLIPYVGQNQKATDAISNVSEKFHKFVFTDNRQSWATIGARELHVLKDQTKQYGTLVKVGVGGTRIFTSTGLLWDKVEIIIEKTGGKAKTDIIICTWDLKSGVKNNYTEYTFPKGKYKKSKKFIINNIHGKSISVKLRNKSAANKFKYAIKSRGFLNMNKQKARASKNNKGKGRRSKLKRTVLRRN